jgi:hypothetical protein
MRKICENAPDAARCFATAILEFCDTGGLPGYSKRKTTSRKDPTYQQSRALKTAKSTNQRQSTTQNDSLRGEVKPISEQELAKAVREKDGELGAAPEPKKYEEQQLIVEKSIPQNALLLDWTIGIIQHKAPP